VTPNRKAVIRTQNKRGRHSAKRLSGMPLHPGSRE
jgi:hypothetical protein